VPEMSLDAELDAVLLKRVSCPWPSHMLVLFRIG